MQRARLRQKDPLTWAPLPFPGAPPPSFLGGGSYLGPPPVGHKGLTAAHALTLVEVREGASRPPGLQVACHSHGRPHLQGRVPLALGVVLVGLGWLLALREDTDTACPIPPFSAQEGAPTHTLLPKKWDATQSAGPSGEKGK